LQDNQIVYPYRRHDPGVRVLYKYRYMGGRANAEYATR